jgi:hypothetical protein
MLSSICPVNGAGPAKVVNTLQLTLEQGITTVHVSRPGNQCLPLLVRNNFFRNTEMVPIAHQTISHKSDARTPAFLALRSWHQEVD